MSENTGQEATADQTKTWQSTQYANVVPHVPSGVYYAPLRIKGKLIWRSLQTERMLIAKLKLADVETWPGSRVWKCGRPEQQSAPCLCFLTGYQHR